MILRRNHEKMGLKEEEYGEKSVYYINRERLPPFSEVIKPKAVKSKKENKKSPTVKELENWMIGLHEGEKRLSYRNIVDSYYDSFGEHPD